MACSLFLITQFWVRIKILLVFPFCFGFVFILWYFCEEGLPLKPMHPFPDWFTTLQFDVKHLFLVFFLLLWVECSWFLGLAREHRETSRFFGVLGDVSYICTPKE